MTLSICGEDFLRWVLRHVRNWHTSQRYAKCNLIAIPSELKQSLPAKATKSVTWLLSWLCVKNKGSSLPLSSPSTSFNLSFPPVSISQTFINIQLEVISRTSSVLLYVSLISWSIHAIVSYPMQFTLDKQNQPIQPISNRCLVNLDERKRFSYKSLASLPLLLSMIHLVILMAFHFANQQPKNISAIHLRAVA